ncbi:MAG: hypothetical protein ACREJ3_20135 [Polyangiaceae bacterium]
MNRDAVLNRNRQAIAGITKHFASTPTLALDGSPSTPKEVIATLNAAINAVDAAATAEKALHDATTAQHAAIAKGNAVLTALKMLVKNQLGSAAGVLGDFGFQSPKRKAPDEATKAAAVAKSKATRAARHTLGKRQKATIKGQGPAATPTAAATPPPAKVT